MRPAQRVPTAGRSQRRRTSTAATVTTTAALLARTSGTLLAVAALAPLAMPLAAAACSGSMRRRTASSSRDAAIPPADGQQQVAPPPRGLRACEQLHDPSPIQDLPYAPPSAEVGPLHLPQRNGKRCLAARPAANRGVAARGKQQWHERRRHIDVALREECHHPG